jgi:hypothetical protein
MKVSESDKKTTLILEIVTGSFYIFSALEKRIKKLL